MIANMQPQLAAIHLLNGVEVNLTYLSTFPKEENATIATTNTFSSYLLHTFDFSRLL